MDRITKYVAIRNEERREYHRRNEIVMKKQLQECLQNVFKNHEEVSVVVLDKYNLTDQANALSLNTLSIVGKPTNLESGSCRWRWRRLCSPNSRPKRWKLKTRGSCSVSCSSISRNNSPRKWCASGSSIVLWDRLTLNDAEFVANGQDFLKCEWIVAFIIENPSLCCLPYCRCVPMRFWRIRRTVRPFSTGVGAWARSLRTHLWRRGFVF